MKIDVLTLFPEMFTDVFNTSILGRAKKAGLIEITLHQLRDWAEGAHKTVDDTPYGGGPGMVMKVDVIDRALTDLRNRGFAQTLHVVLLTPQGQPLTQSIVKKLSQRDHLILIAGHYEGFDERIRSLVDQEISIGDYVLTGGELPAMVVVDALSRLLPGVLGDDTSSHDESFQDNLLEYPQYTRPETYQPLSRSLMPLSVPDILKSGNHAAIETWRRTQSSKRTAERRPDLITKS